MLNNITNKTIYSVSKIHQEAKEVLADQIGKIYLKGECSSVNTTQYSGHWYLTLKDERSQISCVMYKFQNQKSAYVPKMGDNILVKGCLSIYDARGTYQLIIESLEQEGIGKLYLAFEAMKNKLQKEGLFDQPAKKPIPTWVKHVGIITSLSGAVIRDILTVLKRRAPSIMVSVIPSSVQGKLATQELIKAISIGARVADIDLLVLARGGGSLEDLWCFNEEEVARAIYQCSKPIISAVGHETDYSIADFTADLRAATPSVAAELISASMVNITSQLYQYQLKLSREVNNRLNILQLQLNNLTQRFSLVINIVRANSQKLDELAIKMRDILQRQLYFCKHRLNHLEKKLIILDPKNKLVIFSKDLHLLKNKLNWLIANKIKHAKMLLQNCASRLNAASPLVIMERGYSIVKKHDTIITKSEQLQVGDAVTLTLHQGSLACEVKNITNA